MVYIFRYILIFFLSYLTIIAKIEIESISNNSVTLKFLNLNQKSKLAVFISEKNLKPNLNDKLIPLKNENISLKQTIKLSSDMYMVFYSDGLKKINIYDLLHETKYYIKVVNSENKIIIDSLEFFTLSKEPTQQSKFIVFKNVKHNEMTLLFKKGDGSKRVVFVSDNKKIGLPEDGKSYKANSNFRALESAVSNGTFCVYNGNGNELKITGLNPETNYYFRIFEYNGNDQTTNYLLKEDNQNPRNKIMPLPSPIALPAINITSNGFTAKWSKVEGAKYYEIDVSRDSNFNSYVELYEHLDVGNIDEIEVVDLKPGNYYYRLKAIGKNSRSPYSNVIQVTIEENYEKN